MKTAENNKASAMVAMSGGVDSSVAAYLVKEMGLDTIGVTMKLYDNDIIGADVGRTCCSLDDVDDARFVANKLGIPHYVFNFEDDFKKEVIDRFISAYEVGETPNPCIDCNRYIKFRRLFRRMEELQKDYVVTGHYVRVKKDPATGRHLLMKGKDRSKDQSYVLYAMTQEQLTHALFPVGELTKEETREIAESQGFANANKRDSQDICFVPDGDYAGFIKRYTGKDYPEGDFVDGEGNVLGRHKGIIGYTVGQRKGLGLALPEPLYVASKDVANNRVVLVTDKELYSRSFSVGNPNFISMDYPKAEFNCMVKVRYSQGEYAARIIPDGEDRLHVEFAEPQRAITPGQAAVFYDGDMVIGGGVILPKEI